MFVSMNLENLDPEKAKKQIEEMKDVNQSLAHMLQSVLNKYETAKGLPLTKIVEPVEIKDGRKRE